MFTITVLIALALALVVLRRQQERRQADDTVKNLRAEIDNLSTINHDLLSSLEMVLLEQTRAS